MIKKLELRSLIKQFDRKLSEIIQEDLSIIKDVKKYVIQSGGKRIRPVTHYFITRLLNYRGEHWLDIGTIAELIHATSLLHDDVVDGASMRRGKPTVGNQYGNKTAILVGDYLLACGIERLNKFQNPKLMDSFTKVIKDLSVGELVQMEWEKNSQITRKIYDRIIYGKTASLFGAVCETAGILSDLSLKKVNDLHNFGIILGKIFQIKDDYIDYFEDEANSGKSKYKDFFNGLFTHPIILLKEKANKKENQEINHIFSLEDRTSSISKILEYMDKYQIQQLILNDLQEDSNQLIQFLSQFDDSTYRKMMIERIEGLVK